MKIFLAIPAIFLLLVGAFFYNNKGTNNYDVYSNDFQTIKVELKGEIVFSGVYEIPVGTKLGEVVKMAYGFTSNADTNDLNLNRVLLINEVIIVCSKVLKDNQKINLNKADFQTLIQVPNITEKRAASILVYKEQYGLFKSVEELLNVKNIGQATYDKVKDYFTI